MKYYCKIILALVMTGLMLSSCNNKEGEGGTGTVRGHVKLVHHPDDDYQLGADTIDAAKTDVFIVYGDEEFYGDDTETNPDGLYEFNYLTPGDYTVFAYSTLPTGEKVAVSETVTLHRGGVAEVPTIYIHDGKAYGTSIITGKVWAWYFHNNEYRGESWAYEHRVYLRKLGDTYHIDDARVGLNGIFAFQKVLPGAYEVITYTQDAQEVPSPVIDTVTVEANEVFQMVPDTTFIVRIQV
ncbi:MAG: carboxypeptidase regulatory-like domain-containing protein [Bacteroidales bacterium]|nr:carboxypeptidase regulatory-like domain-containing protein [Bacteroidales bacterium]